IAAQDPHTQYAQKHNPTFTGEPKAPTPDAGNNTTRIATTAFVQAAITALINGAPATLDTLKEIAAAINNDPKFSTTINNALAGKQPLDNTLTHLSGKDVAGLLAYLGLGEAAKRDVGNGQNQIPDMSAWECGGDTTTGWRRSPDGYIEQWGLTGATTNEVLINFPIPFPTAVISINEHDQAPVAGKMSVWQFYKLTNSNVIAENLGSLDKGNPSFNVPTVAGCRWFATGR
ncbi:phage tail protein, partial [Escherichia coli]|nr:phage tail protein [Escherichia coli]